MTNPDGVEGKGRKGSSGRVYQVIGTKRGLKGSKVGRVALSGTATIIWQRQARPRCHRYHTIHSTQTDIHTHGSETRQEWKRLTAETVAVAATSY